MVDCMKKSYWLSTLIIVMAAILKHEEWSARFSDYSLTDLFAGLLITWVIYFIFGTVFMGAMNKIHKSILRKK